MLQDRYQRTLPGQKKNKLKLNQIFVYYYTTIKYNLTVQQIMAKNSVSVGLTWLSICQYFWTVMSLYLANLNYVQTLTTSNSLLPFFPQYQIPPIVYLILIAIFGCLNLTLLPLKCKVEDNYQILVLDLLAFLCGFPANLLSSIYTLNPENDKLQIAAFWLSVISCACLLMKNLEENKSKSINDEQSIDVGDSRLVQMKTSKTQAYQKT